MTGQAKSLDVGALCSVVSCYIFNNADNFVDNNNRSDLILTQFLFLAELNAMQTSLSFSKSV